MHNYIMWSWNSAIRSTHEKKLAHIVIVIKEEPQQAALEVLYCWRGQEKRKEKETWKSRSEGKVVGLAHPPYSSQVNGRLSPRVETGIDHPTRRKTQGADIVKVWEGKRDRRCISDTFT